MRQNSLCCFVLLVLVTTHARRLCNQHVMRSSPRQSINAELQFLNAWGLFIYGVSFHHVQVEGRGVQGITKETFPDLVSLLTFFALTQPTSGRAGNTTTKSPQKPGEVSLVIPCNRKMCMEFGSPLPCRHLHTTIETNHLLSFLGFWDTLSPTQCGRRM